MPIFDELRGLVPLPQSNHPINGSLASNAEDRLIDPTEGVLDPAVPIPLPKNNPLGIDTGNTVIDQIYTGISDVFSYIQLPVPDSINQIYGITQTLEGVVQNPINTLRELVRQQIYDILHPNDPGIIPTDKHKEYPKSEEIKGLSDENGNLNLENSGVRAPLVERDPSSYNRIFNNGDLILPDGSLPLRREFIGRESVKDLTLRSVDLWDFKVEPFVFNGIPNIWVPDVQQLDNKIINSRNPYSEVIPLNDPIITDYMPITSYNLDLKTLTTKTLNLYGGSTIQVPELIRYNSQLTFQIVDDENKRWRRWFQTYSENLCDEEGNTVAPYKNSSLLITLIQYRQDHRILAYNQYICALANYQLISVGADAAGVDIIDVELSILGKVELPTQFSYLEIT